MKNILLMICNLAAVSFVFAFIFSFANSLFGTHLGLWGNKVPGGAAALAAFLLVAVVLGVVSYFLNRKNIVLEQ